MRLLIWIASILGVVALIATWVSRLDFSFAWFFDGLYPELWGLTITLFAVELVLRRIESQRRKPMERSAEIRVDSLVRTWSPMLEMWGAKPAERVDAGAVEAYLAQLDFGSFHSIHTTVRALEEQASFVGEHFSQYLEEHVSATVYEIQSSASNIVTRLRSVERPLDNLEDKQQREKLVAFNRKGVAQELCQIAERIFSLRVD